MKQVSNKEYEKYEYWTLIFGTFSSIITNEIYERRLNQ